MNSSRFPEGPVWQIRRSELTFKQLVGKGSFGEVYEGEYKGVNVAIKKLLFSLNDEVINFIESEIEISMRLVHPYIVLQLGCCIELDDLYLVSEFIAGADLQKYLYDKEKTNLPWKFRVSIAKQVAAAMVYLHSKDIIHLDLKSNNLLVTEMVINPIIKVCDFGLARSVKTTPKTEGYIVGTEGWIAPEVSEKKQIGKPADVYSYGMIIWELLAREKPPGRTKENGWKINYDAMAKKIEKSYIPELEELWKVCTVHNFEARPTFPTIIEMLRTIEQKYDATKWPQTDFENNHSKVTPIHTSSVHHKEDYYETMGNMLRKEVTDMTLLGKERYGKTFGNTLYVGKWAGIEILVKKLESERQKTNLMNVLKFITQKQILFIHPNLVRILGVAPSTPTHNDVLFCFEMVGMHDDLLARLRKHGKKSDKSCLGLEWVEKIVQILIQIVSILCFLEKIEIGLKNLKSSQILFQSAHDSQSKFFFKLYACKIAPTSWGPILVDFGNLIWELIMLEKYSKRKVESKKVFPDDCPKTLRAIMENSWKNGAAMANQKTANIWEGILKDLNTLKSRVDVQIRRDRRKSMPMKPRISVENTKKEFVLHPQ